MFELSNYSQKFVAEVMRFCYTDNVREISLLLNVSYLLIFNILYLKIKLVKAEEVAKEFLAESTRFNKPNLIRLVERNLAETLTKLNVGEILKLAVDNKV